MAITGISGRSGPHVRSPERTAGSRQPAEGQPAAGQPAKRKSAGLVHLLKEAWPFLRPQRVLLLVGLGLMAINRLAGLVLPASTKFLVDHLHGKREGRR